MLRNLDLLIEHALRKLALRGNIGATFEDIGPWIREFYHEPTTKYTSASEDEVQGVALDVCFQEAVWRWLVSHDDVKTEMHLGDQSDFGESNSKIHEIVATDQSSNSAAGSRNANNLVPDSAARLHHDESVTKHIGSTALKKNKLEHRLKTARSSPRLRIARIYAEAERMWFALAGHGIDFSRLQPKQFELLSLIGSSGPSGITQPELVRRSGQDKRSVPKRTDSLHENGYITKTKIRTQGAVTSLLILRQFQSLVDTSSEPSGVFRDGKVVEFENFLYTVLQVAKRNATTPLIDVWTHLVCILPLFLVLATDTPKDIIGKRWESRQAWALLERMEAVGLIKRLKSTITMPHGRAEVRRSIQFVKTPSPVELSRFLDSTRQQLYGLQSGHKDHSTINPALQSVSDEELDFYAETLVSKQGNMELQHRGNYWSPDRNLFNSFFDLVKSAGSNGITTMQFHESMSPFWTRPTDQIFAHMTDIWYASQPSHLMHLAIIRDSDLLGKFAHYVFRTYAGFESAVRAGRTSWEVVIPARIMKQMRSGLRVPRGFSALSSDLLVQNNGSTSLINRTRKQYKRRKPGRTSRKYAGALTNGNSVSSPSKVLPTSAASRSARNTSSSTVSHHLERNKFLSLANKSNCSPSPSPERNNEWEPAAAALIQDPETETSTNREEIANPTTPTHSISHKAVSGPSTMTLELGRESPRAAEFSQQAWRLVKFHLDRQNEQAGKQKNLQEDCLISLNSQALYEQFLTLAMPGVYINPPQRVDILNMRKRGRPRKRLLIVIRSDRLRDTFDDSSKQQLHSGLSLVLPSLGQNTNHQSHTRPIATPRMATRSSAKLLVANDEASTPRRELRYGHLSEPRGDSTDSSSATQRKTLTGIDVEDSASALARVEEVGHFDTYGSQSLKGTAGNFRQNKRAAISVLESENVKRRKYATKHRKKFGVGIREGTNTMKRNQIILNLVEKANGILPGGKALYYAVGSAMKSTGYLQVPDEGTMRRAMKSLTASGKLRKLTFAFLAKSGSVQKASIFTLPDVGQQSDEVQNVKDNMIHSYPSLYLPQDIEVDLSIKVSIKTPMQLRENTFTSLALEDAAFGGISRSQKSTNDPATNASSRHVPAWRQWIENDLLESMSEGQKEVIRQALESHDQHTAAVPSGTNLAQPRATMLARARNYLNNATAERKGAWVERLGKKYNVARQAPEFAPASRSSTFAGRRAHYNSQAANHARSWMNPDQVFHIASGTFSSHFNLSGTSNSRAPVSGIRSRKRLPPTEYPDDDMQMPESLEDILKPGSAATRSQNRSSKQKHKPRDSSDAFFRNVEQVRSWEKNNELLFTSIRQRGSFHFINHLSDMPSPALDGQDIRGSAFVHHDGISMDSSEFDLSRKRSQLVQKRHLRKSKSDSIRDVNADLGRMMYQDRNDKTYKESQSDRVISGKLQTAANHRLSTDHSTLISGQKWDVASADSPIAVVMFIVLARSLGCYDRFSSKRLLARSLCRWNGSEDAFKSCIRHITSNYKSELRHIQSEFYKEFHSTYWRHEVPSIRSIKEDTHPDGWQKVLGWMCANPRLNDLISGKLLPRINERRVTTFKDSYEGQRAKVLHTTFFTGQSFTARHDAIRDLSYQFSHVPLAGDPLNPRQESVKIARSLVRARFLSRSYSQESDSPSQEFEALSELALTQSTGSLQRNHFLTEIKDTSQPRLECNYALSAAHHNAHEDISSNKIDGSELVDFKIMLDTAFRRDGYTYCSQTLSDGAVLAALNLAFERQILINVEMMPVRANFHIQNTITSSTAFTNAFVEGERYLSPFGIVENSKVKQASVVMSKEDLFQSIRMRPSQGYVYNSDLPEEASKSLHHDIGGRHVKKISFPDASAPNKSISPFVPFWQTPDGNSLHYFWRKALYAVIIPMIVGEASALNALTARSPSALAFFDKDIQLVLEWLEATGVVLKHHAVGGKFGFRGKGGDDEEQTVTYFLGPQWWYVLKQL